MSVEGVPPDEAEDEIGNPRVGANGIDMGAVALLANAPTVDLWVAPATAIVAGQGAANWAVGTNWSENHSPGNGEIALFDPNAMENGQQGTNTPCYVAAGANLPTISGLEINDWGVAKDANQAGTLTLNSNLVAYTVTINPRTKNAGNSEIIINSGSQLSVLVDFIWVGGSVTGTGSLEVGSFFASIEGTSVADKPTLGTQMDIGTIYNNQTLTGNLLFRPSTQPLVVKDDAKIYVNSGSLLVFDDQAAQGKNSATAISNGDTLPHSIIVNGGTVSRENVCQLYVAMGINVQSGGKLDVTNPGGQDSGNPLHFTGQNPDGLGLEDNGGQINVNGDLMSDSPAAFEWGEVNVASNATLTLGINANSAASTLAAADFILKGTLVPHGGFTMNGGTLGTGGSAFSTVDLDNGNTFLMNSGELDVSNVAGGSARGSLLIDGAFTGGSGALIVINVNEANGQYGNMLVTGAVNGNGATIQSTDLDPQQKQRTWILFRAVVATNPNPPQGFQYQLPPTWGRNWAGGAQYWELNITEQ